MTARGSVRPDARCDGRGGLCHRRRRQRSGRDGAGAGEWAAGGLFPERGAGRRGQPGRVPRARGDSEKRLGRQRCPRAWTTPSWDSRPRPPPPASASPSPAPQPRRPLSSRRQSRRPRGHQGFFGAQVPCNAPRSARKVGSLNSTAYPTVREFNIKAQFFHVDS